MRIEESANTQERCLETAIAGLNSALSSAGMLVSDYYAVCAIRDRTYTYLNWMRSGSDLEYKEWAIVSGINGSPDGYDPLEFKTVSANSADGIKPSKRKRHDKTK